MSREMGGKWVQISVKPAKESAQIDRLGEHLRGILPADVDQHLENGNYIYKPNEQGEYGVTLYTPEHLGFANRVIEHNAFKATRAIEMPEGKEINLPDSNNTPKTNN